METTQEQLKKYFDQQISLCDLRYRELFADGRVDEATFEKVKGNIYDIFRTVFSVAVDTCKADPGQIPAFFMERLDHIPDNWRASYEKAKEHNDTAKMHMEQLKLDIVAQIRENFEKIWEGTQ